MDPLWHSLVEGIIQGATEFVPVSSSAHLIILPELLHWRQPSVAFDVLAHLGTLVAVFLYFADDWRAMAAGLWQAIIRPAASGLEARGAPSPAADTSAPAEPRLLVLLIIGTLPGVATGLLLKGFLSDLIELYPRAAAREASIELMATGLILLAADRWGVRAYRTLQTLGVREALVIGAAQAVAILPGISRSAATIAAGQQLGLSRTDAARLQLSPVGTYYPRREPRQAR